MSSVAAQAAWESEKHGSCGYWRTGWDLSDLSVLTFMPRLLEDPCGNRTKWYSRYLGTTLYSCLLCVRRTKGFGSCREGLNLVLKKDCELKRGLG